MADSQPIPGYCPSCGAIFPTRVGLKPGARVVLEGVVTRCRFCNSRVEMDGEWLGLENAVQLIWSKQLTPEVLKAFAAVIKEAYEKRASPEETKEKAAAIDPALGDVLERLSRSRGLWMSSLIVLMFALSRCNFEVKTSIDVNRLIDQLTNTPPAAVTEMIPMPRPDPRRQQGK